MRLEEEKVISGYHADLSSEALGFTLIAFIHITLATHSPDNAKHFRNLVQRVEAVQEAYSLTGDADYLLKVVLRDLKEPVGHRQQRADAAPERRACALVDRAGPAEGDVEAAAEGIALAVIPRHGRARPGSTSRAKQGSKTGLTKDTWRKSREIRHSQSATNLRSSAFQHQ